MTANDKKLLMFACTALIILAMVMFGIKPGITNFNEAKAKKAELEVKKTSMETEINKLPAYKVQLESAIANYQTTADRVYGDLTSDKIHDAVVNDLVAPCGLTITNFSIADISKRAVTPFSVIKNEAGQDVGSGGTAGENPTIRTANISISVFGSADQIVTLIDKLNNDEGIYLQQTSFANSTESTTVTISFLMVLSETF